MVARTSTRRGTDTRALGSLSHKSREQTPTDVVSLGDEQWSLCESSPGT
jgi:hypothetical protein